MKDFFVYVKSQYTLHDVVRVTIVIEEGYNKEDVIQAVCDAMKNEPTFELHNTKLMDDVFTINVKASKVEMIKKIDGVKLAEISKKVELTGNQSNLTLELEKKEETVTNDYTSFYFLGGIVFVAVLFLGIKKFKKH